MPDLTFPPEQRMMIDAELTGADSGATIASVDPPRIDLGQHRGVVRRRLAVRRIQGQRDRPPAERRRGLRAAPRDQGHRLAQTLTTTTRLIEAGPRFAVPGHSDWRSR